MVIFLSFNDSGFYGNNSQHKISDLLNIKSVCIYKGTQENLKKIC